MILLYKLFTWSRITYVAILVVWAAILALCIARVLPRYFIYIDLVITVAAEIAVNYICMGIYQNMTKLADTDIDAFVKQQDQLAAKQKGKMHHMILSNIIVILLEYDRLDEVRRRLNYISQITPPNDFNARFQYSSILMTLDIKCRNFQGIDFYINDMKMCLTNIGPMTGVTAKTKQKWEFLIEMNLAEAEFYSRTPQALATTDRHIAQRYLADLDHFRLINKDNKLFPGAFITQDLYCRGTACAVLGDMQNANMLLSQVASLPYSYPAVRCAGEYIRSGDINIIFRP